MIKLKFFILEKVKILMSTAYLSLGSNIGDRIGFIQQAHSLLNDSEGIKVVDCSSLYETEPIGVEDQEWFINAALKVETTLSPQELMKKCLDIENILGRVRDENTQKWGPRCIDIDILFYDEVISATDFLQLPHPRVDQRAFTLVPMLEIAQDFVHPVLNKSIEQLYNELEEPEEVYLYGTRPRGNKC